jgi:ubiquinone/menaquinone biosynthesis C-methylase UbiE
LKCFKSTKSTTTIMMQLPPAYHRIQQHEAFPDVMHDEKARYNFLANLNKHLATVVAPGNEQAFEKRVKPAFKRKKKREFESREEVKDAMQHNPQYQLWSALRRSAMEMRQQAGRSLVLRQARQLADKADLLNQKSPNTLILNPKVKVPHYLSVMDNHCMPGSYHTELIAKDVSAAANYDSGIFVTTAGGLGRLSDGGGKAIALHLKNHFPDFQPKRILDIGCGLGHNTLPLAIAFPQAEVIGIDVAAPMLRYGHARMVSLGVKNVKFIQADAQKTGFEAESFDWIQTTMFLHETSFRALYGIGREIYRMLRDGGLSLHIEQPQYSSEMSLFEQFMRDWDAYHNNEPFWGKMHDIDVSTWMKDCGFKPEKLLQFCACAVNDQEDYTKPRQPDVEDYGRAGIWNVFGAWK